MCHVLTILSVNKKATLGFCNIIHIVLSLQVNQMEVLYNVMQRNSVWLLRIFDSDYKKRKHVWLLTDIIHSNEKISYIYRAKSKEKISGL